MRRRPLLWLSISLLCFVAAVYFWRLGDKWASRGKARPAPQATNQAQPSVTNTAPRAQAEPFNLLTQQANLEAIAAEVQSNRVTRLAYRLSNTTRTVGELTRSDKAILLENALFDTAVPTALNIPDDLRAQGDPGTYIVQSKTVLDQPFRDLLARLGAGIVAYVPNNAYLVRASQAITRQLESDPRTQAVLPFEPYYKLKASLLGMAVRQESLAENTVLNVLLFADARNATIQAIQQLGAEVLSEDPTPFGPLLRVRPPGASLPWLAGLSGVQTVELAPTRLLANDLSRARIGVAPTSVDQTNYLALTGNGIIVNINDTGVSTNHPDLAGRVLLGYPDVNGTAGYDTNGHGTHVGGIIASSGGESLTVTNAQGSIMPPTNGQFRGMAPAAKLFSLPLYYSDFALQQAAASTNALISNNSWQYNNNQYDIAAACYDAAVRDALPMTSGSQPVLFVFAAGNIGGGSDDGQGGNADTILSPATAKNVISVGAIEQLRNITNKVATCQIVNQTNLCVTNTPFGPPADSSDQVASFSSRGNVGVGIEGDFGRFKPDVVAPGTFVVSTRSPEWDQAAYYNPTNFEYIDYGLFVISNRLLHFSINLPDNTAQWSIRARAFSPVVDLPIYVRQNGLATNTPGGFDFVRTNTMTMPPDPGTPSGGWNWAIANSTTQAVHFSLVVAIGTTNNVGDYWQVFSNLNNELGPFYRYETGTSMAAADASGTLALIQEFFEQRLHVTNSPALMKALLINGARAFDGYDFNIQGSPNSQGWGCISLPFSLPGAMSNVFLPGPGPIKVFDQSPTNALATGQSRTRFISLTPAAQAQPLRVTLAWTDPPGNPVVGIKLVNDLDLVLTNLDTGEVFFGNDITSGFNFNQPWNTNNPASVDLVNNVENVYLNPVEIPLGSNYSVTVIGHRVNVNAVTAHTNDIVQDYALVISSGNGTSAAATLTLREDPIVMAITPNVTWPTNSFGNSTLLSGGLLLNQRLGANSPLLGTNTLQLADIPASPWNGGAGGTLTLGQTNQWHFYVFTNFLGATNAAFTVFTMGNLALPRMGATNEITPENSSRLEPDIDLYVSINPGLTNLDPFAVSNADKSLGRFGTELLVFTNAIPGAAYYVGVKSEDQQSAEFGIIGVFSVLPFGGVGDNGNAFMTWFPVPADIPDGTPAAPGYVLITGIPVTPMEIRRVIATNTILHQNLGDLVGNVSHGRKAVILNNHRAPPLNPPSPGPYGFIYEDNDEGDVFPPPGYQLLHSDGPGTLRDFIGDQVANGPWFMLMGDNSLTQTGRVLQVDLTFEPHQVGARVWHLEPGQCKSDYIDVPPSGTNLTICVFSNTAPLDLSVGLTPDATDYRFVVNPPGDCFSIDYFSVPPLQPGRYYFRLCNNSQTAQTVLVTAEVILNPSTISARLVSAGGSVPITEDGVVYSYLTNLNHLRISSLDIGMLIRDPRISDLAITLVSPNGTRILLFENRGAWSTNGLGTFSVNTNSLGAPVFAVTNMAPFWTNDFEQAGVGWYAPGSVFQGWNVLTNYVRVVPDLSLVWRSNNILVLGDGVISNALPTTNSVSYSLSYRVSHAPYLVGMVGWWPLDFDASDIWGGLDGLLSGGANVPITNYLMFSNNGEVNRAFFGDGVRTRIQVPRCPDIDVGQGRGFSIEGWINPSRGTAGVVGGTVMEDGFENATPQFGVPAGSIISGWLVESGDVDVLSPAMGVIADSGLNCVDLSGNVAGSISTNFATVPGRDYLLSFAYTRNPATGDPAFVARATIAITGQTNWLLNYDFTNTQANLAWFHTSRVFTATSPMTKLQLTSDNPGNGGMFVDTFKVVEFIRPGPAMPLAEWNDPTNINPQGVQFWVNGFATNPLPGALSAAIWDTNFVPHFITTTTNALTNGGWQHVALTYDTNSGIAALYVNGLTNGQPIVTTNMGFFVPRTTGDLYFGYHPGTPDNLACYSGGLDEFSLYNRALSPLEVSAIFGAGSGGKYGTNVLWCPVTNAIAIVTTLGSNYFSFTNGLTWQTNGLTWETNVVAFPSDILRDTNGVGTNLASLYVWPLDPNTTVDDFILSALTTNYFDGLLHFSEDTNVARLPIKFASAPYTISNFPPTLIFTNDFENSTQRLFQAGETIVGSTNNALVGQRSWTVTRGSVTVLSNVWMDAGGTNCLVLGVSSVQSPLPTAPGHRYQLTYSVRGPGAVGWWNGDTEPYSRRAFDLIGGNHAAYMWGATNVFNNLNPGSSEVGNTALFFSGLTEPTNGFCPKLELGDPANLRLTNSFTIEGWIRPLPFTNFVPEQVEQIFFRGDSRNCLDPYWLGIEQVDANTFDVVFHIEDDHYHDCGIILETAFQPIQANRWHHIAAVFESNVPWTNNAPWPTNELRLYVDGRWLDPGAQEVYLEDPLGLAFDYNEYTGRNPFRDLDPSFSPGISIGARSRYDYTEPYRGYLDELTVYGRALTAPEIRAIAGRGRTGKADTSMPPALSLAKVRVSLNNMQMDLGNGDNARWTERTITFTADATNTVLDLTGLLPGTLIDGISLTELPAELHYLPEESLDVLNGEDGYGVWALEIRDTRTGSTNDLAQLVQWQLDFQLVPSNPPPVIYLTHGITYTNTLVGFGVQNFVVPVPQWATNATNVLIFTTNRFGGNPNVSLYIDTNYFPDPDPLVAPWIGPVAAGQVILSTNTLPWFITPGQPYYLTLTNPNPTAATFALGVWFDILSLTNCQAISNYVGPAGIPRYFQFDVPTNGTPADLVPKEVSFWLTGAQSNLTVVFSQHLPLPDLRHYDYISDRPCTNAEVVMVVTNTTPFNIQSNRWYVGVFGEAATNIPFTVQACVQTDYPLLIPLTNGVPFVVDSVTNLFAAPPGPPQNFFFEFDVTNYVDGILFELYNLSGNADLTLQRDVPNATAPYRDGSFRTGTTPEHIVLRVGRDVPDLRGKWYLGIFNNEQTNKIAYTVHAVTPVNGLLVSAQGITYTLTPPAGGRGFVIQWTSVVGEAYAVEYSGSFNGPWSLAAPIVIATTPFSAVQTSVTNSPIFFQVRQVPRNSILNAPLHIMLWTPTMVRLSWPANFLGYTLQWADNLNGPWFALNLPVVQEGNEFAVYDLIGVNPRFYRLVPP